MEDHVAIEEDGANEDVIATTYSTLLQNSRRLCEKLCLLRAEGIIGEALVWAWLCGDPS